MIEKVFHPSARIRCLIGLCLSGLCLMPFLACSPSAPPPATDEARGEASSASTLPAAAYAYRNAVNKPPPEWEGPVFELSHDYPSSMPAECPPSECPWLAVDVDFNSRAIQWDVGWSTYMQSILDYLKQGQPLSPAGWKVEVEDSTRWYHVPWMAFDPKSGREFIHGMTNERTATVSDLLGHNLPGHNLPGHNLPGHNLPGHNLPASPEADEGFESWAFGVYNAWGAQAFGQSWDGEGEPVLEERPTLHPAGLPFRQGTLVVKLLFTTATPEEVYYLRGSPEWMVNRHVEVGGCERKPQPVRLLQMDVAVVDERSPSRWVYGTFGYNGTLVQESDDPWGRMSPLGLQWGYDPQTFPAVPRARSVSPYQTVLAPIDIYEHFGCEGRLAGPVDNPRSSCLSCHGNGYVHLPVGSDTVIFPADQANIPPIFGFPGICTEENATNTTYFTGLPYPETWPTHPNTMSVDTSLQLLVAFQSYGAFKTHGGNPSCTPSPPASL